MPFIRQKNVTKKFVGYRIHVIVEDVHCNSNITRHVEDCETYEAAVEFWDRIEKESNQFTDRRIPPCLTFVTDNQDSLERLECYQHTGDGHVFRMKHISEERLLDLQTQPTRYVSTLQTVSETFYYCNQHCQARAAQRFLIFDKTPTTKGIGNFPPLTCCEDCGKCL